MFMRSKYTSSVLKNVIGFNKIVLLFAILFSVHIKSKATVASYCFHQLTGAYSSINGGDTTYATGTFDNAIYTGNIGFTFNFNGTNYTTLKISSNGFVAFGTAPTTTNYTPISSNGSSGIISAFGRNLIGGNTFGGDLSSKVSGTAPNRTFTIEWANMARYISSAENEEFSFQIILHETTNQIEIIYDGGWFFSNLTSNSATVQVGLRGATNTDYNNRKTAPWDATVAGTANNSNINSNDVDYPETGLKFIYSPTSTVPTTQASNINFTSTTYEKTTVNWTNGNGAYRMVVAKVNGVPSGVPTNGLDYTASATFGSGQTIAPGEYVVYFGNVGSNVTVTGLSPDSTYGFKVYEINCGNYNSSNATNNPTSVTLPHATYVCGAVMGNWNLAGSPYVVTCSLNVPYGQTLTIDPGVLVEFKGYYNILVDGTINASGTSTDSIKFYTNSSSWAGIYLDNTPASNDSSIFEYCKFSKATASSANGNYGGAFYIRNFSKVRLSYCRINSCNSNAGGAAIYCENSSINIFNCNFAYNLAKTVGGGAIYFKGNASPNIKNSTFSNNNAYTKTTQTSFPYTTTYTYYNGGAIYVDNCSPVFLGNTFTSNKGLNGGAVYAPSSSVSFNNNNFTSNTASGANGGAIYLQNSNSVITGNSFNTNSSVIGGAIYCTTSTLTLNNNKITNNTASSSTSGGGGLYCNNSSPTGANNLFANNQGTTNGGAIFLEISSNPAFTNCTFANNKGSTYGGAIYCKANSNPIFKNCIFYGNTSTNGAQVYLYDELSDPSFYYSLLQGGAAIGIKNAAATSYTGNYIANINAFPNFVAPTAGSGTASNGSTANWTLQNTSPCIDKGDSSTYSPATDLAGNPRVNVCRIDMGAYEYQLGIPLDAVLNQTAPILCPGSASGEVVATATGGSGNYTYTWSNAQTNDTISTLLAGTYNVTIHDQTYSCDIHRSITIIEPIALLATYQTENINCVGGSNGSITVNASGGTGTKQYSNDGGTTYQTSNVFNGLAIGSYNMVVKDSGNCTITQTINLTVSPLILNTSLTNTICGQNIGSILASASGGKLPYTFAFSSGTNIIVTGAPLNATVNNLSTGIYSVTLTDSNGCSNSSLNINIGVDNADYSINFSATPTSGYSPLLAGFTNTTPSPSLYNFTWIWGDGNTLTSNNLNIPHNYQTTGFYDVSLIATNISSGCMDTLTKSGYIFVSGCTHNAVVSPTGPINACVGDAISLYSNTNPSYTYQWLQNGNPMSGSNDTTIIVTQSGNYSVKINLSGCVVTSSSVQINFNTNPAQPTITSSGNINSCGGGNVTLISSTISGSGYSWNTSELTQSISVSVPGNYTVTATDNISGCSNTSVAYSVNTTPTQTQNICLVTVDSTSTYNIIIWEKPITSAIDSFKIWRVQTASIDTLVGTVSYEDLSEFNDITCDPNVTQYDYKISVIDTCGNESAKSPFHRTILMTTSLGFNQCNLQWNQYVGNTVNQYHVWRDSTLNGNWQLLATLSPASTTYIDNNWPATAGWRYRIDVDWVTSCLPTARTAATATNTTRSNTKDNYRVTGLSQLNANDVMLFPNPAGELINLSLNANAYINNINVLDATGRLVKTIVLNNKNNQAQINTGDLARGIYFMEVNTNAGIVRKSFVRE